MKFNQTCVASFSVIVIIIANCYSSIAAPWAEGDGMRLIVPKRMAKLLKKITKHEFGQGKFEGKLFRHVSIQ